MVVDAGKTLGAAWLQGLRPHVRCRRGKRMGPAKVEPCGYDAYLCLQTLLWKCGAKYPCWRLARFLKCPRCGGESVQLAWVPGPSPEARFASDLYQCQVARDAARPR